MASVTPPAFDLGHPLYREAIALLAPGAQDVLGAMLIGGSLEFGAASPQLLPVTSVAQSLSLSSIAFPFSIGPDLPLEGVVLCEGEGLLHLIGALLGDPGPAAAIEEIHVPMLRDTLANVLGRWSASVSAMLGQARQEVSLESAADPLMAGGVLLQSSLARSGPAILEHHPFLVNGAAGSLQLWLTPAAATVLVTSHPAYTPPETAPMDAAMSAPTPGPAPGGSPVEPIAVGRPQFQQLGERQAPQTEPARIDLLKDVPLTITVELGRQDLTIKEILELSPGALIELNRLAGEPLDLMINGQLFAKGEVVVIDESFGMRITSIVSPEERLQSLR
ncbi:MAG: hypothetical protein GEEBNDBF_01669 [bacterium]|nr:hypothetical protein [bacterium]